MRRFSDPDVAALFRAYPPALHARLMALRQSGLVGQFRALHPGTFRYQGERAILFGTDDRVPTSELSHCIALALTHHARKKRPRSQ
jgi:hypothetical protein